MQKVFLYSFLLIMGMLLSQVVDLTPFGSTITTLGGIGLSYIMMEVGLEFSIDKNNLSSYGKDYLIAVGAATIPWILCGFYFWFFFSVNVSEAAHVSRFAAPTSAGVLFAMLAAAGLARTWVFKKARILAIFDDLDTVLMIIPLQMIHLGFRMESLMLIGVIIVLLGISYRYLHRLRLPVSRLWLLVYSLLLVLVSEWLDRGNFLHLEVLLPSFLWGCLLRNPHQHRHFHEHAYVEPDKKSERHLDSGIKLGYMFLVGCALPKISTVDIAIGWLCLHVLAITFLSNLGKFYVFAFYKNEASWRERLALSIAMFPRGEVGGGILLLSVKYAIGLVLLPIAQASLAVNLLLTGLFIYAVMRLVITPPAK